MKRFIVWLPVWVALFGSSPRPAAQSAPVVTPPAGTLRGAAAGDIRVFKGIPYAVPPTGPLRWKPPVPAARWSDTRDATEFGPVCMQAKPQPTSIYAWDLRAMSEDCLSLNVWAPAGARNAPVFFWIHGGALSGGSGGDPLYDGARLAARGLVVVSINYRLGVLGFLAHPELSAESGDHVSGNYGLLDQIAALRWVNRNVAAFGGDPDNVTIAGESAGGLSVMYLLAARDARGLFAKAVMESAYMVSAQELRTSTLGTVAAETAGLAVAQRAGAADLAALRATDAGALVAAGASTGFFPFFVIDGHVLTRQIVDVFDRGEQAKVPMLAGFNSGEIRSLRTLLPPKVADAATYEKVIRERYADLAGAFLTLYPSGSLEESVLATTRDALYGWTSERLVVKQTAAGVPSYLYLFDHGYPAADSRGLHAFHASELPYVFGTAERTPANWPAVPSTPAETQLANAMLGYWSSFARTGTPAAHGQPAWPAYGSTRAYMAFEDAPHAKTHLMPGMYELNEQVVCRRRTKGGIPWHWNVGLASPPLPADAPQCR
jgi:para-nitrobenzyl esterase